jgi:beta-glucosidase
VKPLFPFGYGLSYTTFKYANLSVTPQGGASSGSLYTVSFDVTNTGGREGAAVAQVYVADGHSKIARPPKELKGFAKVVLKPGEMRHVSVALNARAFAYFDPTAKGWRISPGNFGILVGSSSEQIELQGPVVVPDAAANTKM